MRRLWNLLALPLLIGAFVAGCGEEQFVVTGDSIQWVESMDVGYEEARTSGKPVMIDVYTDWCVWCHVLDQQVYSAASVVEKSKEFVSIKLNADENPEDAEALSIDGFPTVIFTDSEGKEISRIVGFVEAKEFAREMESALSKLGS